MQKWKKNPICSLPPVPTLPAAAIAKQLLLSSEATCRVTDRII